MTVGTSKGWTSGNHAEIHRSRMAGKSGEELAKEEAALDGNVTSYTFCPLADSEDPTERDTVCLQYSWAMEELYDETGEVIVAHRYWKLIYDHAHSDDELWKKTMDETAEIHRTGQANHMPEKKRKASMQRAYENQRNMCDTSNLGKTACTMYKKIKYNQDIEEVYKAYAGATDSHCGYPLFTNMKRQLPAASKTQPLTAHPVYGGSTPLGPTFALNAKRDGVLMAGLVGKDGKRIKIHRSQRSPAPYFNKQGFDSPLQAFIPPKFVEDKGAMHMCHSPVMNNIMHAPLPRPIHGDIVPDDVLLEMFYEVRGDKNHRIASLRQSGKVTHASDCLEELKTQFFGFMTARDQVTESIQQAILNNSMLQNDSLDPPLSQPDMRIYGQNSKGTYIVEPVQVLKDLSEELCRAFSIVSDWKAQSTDAQNNAETRARKDLKVDDGNAIHQSQKLFAHMMPMVEIAQKRFADATDAVIRMGLKRFDHAFSSKRLQEAIPPGWVDIWKGTKQAIKDAGQYAKKCKVDPKSPHASAGTANMAFAFDVESTASDMSPWAHWRTFQMAMLSTGASINGPDVRLMLEGYLQVRSARPEAPKPSELTMYAPTLGGRRWRSRRR